MIETQPKNAAFLPNIETAFEATVTELRKKLYNSPPAVRRYTEHLSLSQGKSIRAHCVLAASMADDGTIPADAVRVACAVELVHLASLVHDDVIDDSPVRRGNLTLQKKFGKKEAVICGDWLLCLALTTASQVSRTSEFSADMLIKFASRLCLGELSQQEHTGDYNLGYYRYLAIISGKTAALFEAAFFCGARLTYSTEQGTIASLAKFGRYFGLIFQLIDDCIDYEQDETNVGKPVQSDYSQGTVTLPLMYALRTDKNFKAHRADFSAAEVVKRVKKIGGVIFTKKVANAYSRKALDAIACSGITEQKKEILTNLLKKAMDSCSF